MFINNICLLFFHIIQTGDKGPRRETSQSGPRDPGSVWDGGWPPLRIQF
jgi:hypothetical protein